MIKLITKKVKSLISTTSILKDWREKEIHPIEGVYRCKGNSFLLDVPIDEFMSSRLVDVWVNIVTKLDTGEKASTCKDILQEYFKEYQPKNVAEALGIRETNISPWLNSHPLKKIYPWGILRPEQAYIKRKKMMKRESREYNFELKSDDWKGFGPVSDSLIDFEFSRLVKLYKSIKKEGFNEKYGFIGGQIFAHNENYKVRIKGGWHRFSILKALNYDSISIKFNPINNIIIRREDVNHWPAVKEGYFTFEEALQIFDNKFKR